VNPDLEAASAALAQERLGDVLAPLERAVASGAPTDAAHWQGVLEIAGRIGDDDLALLAARRLLALAPRDVQRRALVLDRLAEVGAVREALAIARKLETERPTDPMLPVASGICLARLGREEEAIRSLRLAIRRAPQSSLAWERLASLRTFRPLDPELAELERLAAATGERPEGAAFAYALAKAYDDIDDVDRAYAWFARGAAGVLGGRRPRMERLFAEAAEVRNAFPPERLQSGSATGRPERPILIIGCARSGTTLLERILASSPAAISAGELKMLHLACLGFSPPSPASIGNFVQACGGELAAWQRVAETYVGKLVRRFGRADGVIDKGLVNYLYVGALAQALPQARIIHVRRDPMDVAWSCFRRLFDNGLAWSYDFESIAAFIRVYADVAAYWKQVLPGRILSVDFERLVAEPEAETARVFDFVGIERPPDWRSFHEKRGVVLTSSLQQVRRPLSADGVGAWRRYAAHLGALEDALARQGLLEAGGA
jgi:tetratricopeptide (TPR) repeat protein